MKNSVKIDKTVYDHLNELAKISGESMQDVLEKAIEAYRMRRILKDRTLTDFGSESTVDEFKPGASTNWDAAVADDFED